MTTLTDYTTSITAEGEYAFPSTICAVPCVLSIISTEATAVTITPGYSSPSGEFVAFLDSGGLPITTASTAAWQVIYPDPAIPAVKVVGAGTHAISVRLNRVAY